MVLVLIGLCGCATRPPPAFQFAVIGDLQYDRREEEAFPFLIDALNKEPLAFVVHLGDFKSGGAICADELYLQRRAEFSRSHHAFVLVPGDNDWVDCRRKSNGSMDPLKRLDWLRSVFYPDDMSLGVKAMRLVRQSAGGGRFAAYRENVMWSAHGVVFATLNIQGSNDNVGFDAASDAEQRVRLAANAAWIEATFARAKKDGAIGVAFFQQANPGFEEPDAVVHKSAFVESTRAFEAAAAAAGLPVLFVHGDTHTFRVDKPYVSPLTRKPIANVTRLEGFGNPFIDWVRVGIDNTQRDNPFVIERGGFRVPE
jgi:hypothetical protein